MSQAQGSRKSEIVEQEREGNQGGLVDSKAAANTGSKRHATDSSPTGKGGPRKKATRASENA
eukprot:5075328-Pyramimonas_sp.AAC.1